MPWAVYLLWVAGTWLLEGRLNLLQEPNLTLRLLYQIVVNIGIGTIVPLWLLRNEPAGFQPWRRTLLFSGVSFALGLLMFVLQRPPTYDLVVLGNVFAQVLPVSVAEVAVCWALIGSVLERRFGKLAAMAGSAILFGVYHFAHSAPFNEPRMVLLLMLPGLGTSLVYFLGREIVATLVFHNFMALYGVARALPLEEYQSIHGWSWALAAASIASLIAMAKMRAPRQESANR